MSEVRVKQKPGVYRLSLGSLVTLIAVTIHLLPGQQFLVDMKIFLWKFLENYIWKVRLFAVFILRGNISQVTKLSAAVPWPCLWEAQC